MKNKKLDIKMLMRIIKYITKYYKLRIILVITCLILSTISSVAGNLYLQVLIDDYIVPLVESDNPIYTSLIKAIITMIGIYGVGVITTLVYSLVMARISEGTLKKIRDEMFSKMQALPIEFFDTHTHGDIMSRYTNDTDTLSQMISQSLPQLLTSAITIVVVFISMLASNFYLTLVTMASLIIVLIVTKNITARSGKYFIKQQESVGKLNGYIEEMINGQKVVKVFNYEERAKNKFDELNDKLCEEVYNANRFANILFPINGALGNVQYALLATVGGIFAVNRNRKCKCWINSIIFAIK